MPFQPINFAGMPVQGNEMLRNLVPNLMAAIKGGMELRNAPDTYRRQAEQEELANSLNRMKLESEPGRISRERQIQEDALYPEKKAQRLAQTYSSLMSPGNQQQSQYSENMPEYMKQGQTQPQEMSPQQKLTAQLYKQIVGIPDSQEEMAAADRKKRDADFLDFSRKEGFKFGNSQQLESAKQNFEKTKLGIQSQNSMALERLKQSLKDKGEGSDFKLTPTIKTDLQGKISSVDRLVPQIEELSELDVPNQLFQHLSGPKQKKYESLVAGITDAYIKAKGLPSTNESISMVKHDIFSKGYSENDDEYRNRLKKEVKDLSDIRNYSVGALKSGRMPEIAPERKDTDKEKETGAPPAGSVIIKPVRGHDGVWRIR